MTTPLEQYSAALAVRDAREKAHQPYIEAYTRLANRTATMSLAKNPTAETDSTVPSPTGTAARKSPKPPTSPPPPTGSDDASTLRAELASTQKARAQLSAQTAALTGQLATAQKEAAQQARRAQELGRLKMDTERRLRERDEELRGQRGLVEQAQDEMVALGLQLHMAEQKAERLGQENAELVERWLRRMGEEADKMNRDSRWE